MPTKTFTGLFGDAVPVKLNKRGAKFFAPRQPSLFGALTPPKQKRKKGKRK